MVYHIDLTNQACQGYDNYTPKSTTSYRGLSQGTAFQQQITEQCLTESAIDPGLFEAALAFHHDLEQDGNGDVSTPIHEALGWKYSRFGNQARANFEAALFLQESGECWQAKVSFTPADGKKGYFAPTGAGSKPFLPPVPPHIRQRIADRYGCDVPMDGSFWDWVAAHPELEIVYTEGGKKALSLLSQGYIAISLYGVNGGYRAKDKIGAPIAPVLIPELVRFCHEKRPATLAFDQDSAAKTRRKVTAALFKFGGLMGGSGCVVKLALWDGRNGKGIDDLIGAHGSDVAQKAITDALTLDEYRLTLALQNQLGGLAPALRINTRDLSTIQGTAIPQSGILAMASAKGTGKTTLLSGLVDGDDPTLVLGHRIALMRNICRRLGVNYRGDLDKVAGRYTDGGGFTLRVGGCVDGTLLSINPADFAGCDLILDEVVQVLRHLLTSSTCNKDGKRPVLLARFAELVQSARRVILADADLDKATINYIQALRGDDAPAWLLVNDAKVDPWPVDFIEAPDASAIVSRTLDLVADGKRVFIATDSKAGSKKLNKLINGIEGAGGKVLLLNSDTSGGEIEQDYIKDPDANLDHNVVIASPSMATGVSIEAQDAYDVVVGIFWGASSTDADMAQALARVRQPIPRVVWCAKRGSSFSRIGRDTNPLRLRKLLQDKTNATAQLTAVSLGTLGQEVTGYDWLNPHVAMWASIEAQRNRSMMALRSALKCRLIHEGHKLNIIQLGTNEAARDALSAARLQIKETEARAIANAPNLTPAQVTALESAESIDPDERYALQKWHVADFYAVPLDEVSSDLVLADNDGRRRGQLRDLEQFINPDLAPSADVLAIGKQAQWHRGICPWDTPHAELRRKVREILGLGDWLNANDDWRGDSKRLATFKAKALQMAPQIKAALNVSIHADMSGAQILGQLLDQIGIATDSKQVRIGGNRTRLYWIDQDVKTQNMAILERRALRRKPAIETEVEPVTPPPKLELIQGGCDTLETPKTVDPARPTHRWATMGLDGWLEGVEGGVNAAFKAVSGAMFTVFVGNLEAIA
jgi:hypothetical protein